MTDAMCAYLSLNQLLMGKKVKELPSVAVEYLKRNQLLDAYSKALEVTRIKVEPLTRIFLNTLRSREYAFNIPEGTNEPLMLSQVAQIARENSYDPDTCAHWGIYLISDVRASTTGEDYVADSVLYLTAETEKKNPDLDSAMHEAFALYTYGTPKPSDRQMRVVTDVFKLYTIDGDTRVTTEALASILRAFVTAQLSPRDVGEFCMELSDLAIPLRITKALCYWGDYTRTTVHVIVPRAASQTTLVIGILPINEFIAMIKSSPNVFVGACAKGQRLVFKEAVSALG